MSGKILRSLLGLVALVVAGGVQAQVVISQAYGGGGNSGATYKNDFIELFNRGSTSQSLNGWSVQYASATGGAWTVTNLTNVTLQPGQYYLVQEAAGSGGTTSLPTPDAIGTIAMGGTAFKVALVGSTTALSGTCPTGYVDLLGAAATATCFEGTGPAPAPSNTTADIRANSGCTDTDNNSADFSAGAPTPRNTATATNVCGGGTTLSVDSVSQNEGDSGITNFVFTVSLSAAAPTGGVTFDIATANDTGGANPADSADYVSQSLASQTIAAGNTTYQFTVQVNGDTTPEPDETFLVNVSNISGTGVTTTSAQGKGTIVNDDIANLKIGAIQGTGDASPYAGQTVKTIGNVVTVVSGNNFYMQDPVGDGNPDTSDAIYVFRGSTSTPVVAVGDVVDVTGPIVEFSGTTEFSGSPQTVTLAGSGGPITPVQLNGTIPSPDPLVPVCHGTLPAGNVGEGNWECLESMLVSFNGVVVGATSGGFSADATHAGLPGSFYATVDSVARPFREVGAQYPGLGGTIPVWDGNPEIIEIYLGKGYNGIGVAAYNAGQTFAMQAVVADFSGGYELYPTAFTPGSPPSTVQPVADSVAGTLTIASQNMLHFYDDMNDPGAGDDCTTQGSADTCPTTAQFDIRRAKLSLQVRNVLKAPAVIGAQEVENINALQKLADQIHSDDTSLTYTPYLDEGNDIGGIDVGFLVRSDVTVNAVTQIGLGTQTNDGCGGAPPCILNDRPPLLLDASFGGQRFAVLVIHNRSLSSADTTRVQRKRLEQAEYVAAIVQAWQTGTGSDVALVSPDADVTLGASGETVPAADGSVPLVIVGDYNAYEFTDGYVDVTGQIKGTAVQADNMTWATQTTTPTLCDAGLTTDPATRYSFMFDGYVQELDHALLTRTAWTDFVSLHNAHGNADTSEAGPEVTDTSTPARSADHDGQVVTLTFDRLFGDAFEGDTCR
ncbi:MAG TPA: lamin tail domain-containing protein [Rudaea sp.]|nr:lamin tail domain-containing protein [Rudaea sp.]